MQCHFCGTAQQLLCRECCQVDGLLERKAQLRRHIERLEANLNTKIQPEELQKMYADNQKLARKRRRQQLRSSIDELALKITKQRGRGAEISELRARIEGQSQPKQNKVLEQMHQSLIAKNNKLAEQLVGAKRVKMTSLQRWMEVYKMDKMKYKMQRYFRLGQTQELVFSMEADSDGIPFIKKQYYQLVMYQPPNDLQQNFLAEEQHSVIETLKLSTRFVSLLHAVFMRWVKLPYKIFCSEEKIYLDNLMISLMTRHDIGTQAVSHAVNMLQANIEYLARAVGLEGISQGTPCLVLDREFCEHLGRRNFKFLAERQAGRPQIYLKYLNMNNIRQKPEESDFDKLAQIYYQDTSMSIYKVKESEEFQVLE